MGIGVGAKGGAARGGKRLPEAHTGGGGGGQAARGTFREAKTGVTPAPAALRRGNEMGKPEEGGEGAGGAQGTAHAARAGADDAPGRQAGKAEEREKLAAFPAVALGRGGILRACARSDAVANVLGISNGSREGDRAACHRG